MDTPKVFVLGKNKQPLMPCSEKRARLLLDRGRAVVHRMAPFTIRLKDRKAADCDFQPIKLLADPGSKGTGIALVREDGEDRHVLCLIELVHRGFQIRSALEGRRGRRRDRRSRLRYRAPRFNNRTRKPGWLPPSLQHRVDGLMSRIALLKRLAPITSIAVERVKFDMHKMQNPEISSVEYQQGTLQGYEVREYLLEKYGRACAYCGTENVPLQIEHIVSKYAGGSNRISNLAIACHDCNSEKGKDSLDTFFATNKGLKKRLKKNKKDAEAQKQRVMRLCKAPLKDAAAVNATRNAIYRSLLSLEMPLTCGTGSQTKYNRMRLEIPKEHALDAACVGEFNQLHRWDQRILVMSCKGRGSYQRTQVMADGLPKHKKDKATGEVLKHPNGKPVKATYMKAKKEKGFQTGDLVIANVPKGVNAGIHMGRVAIRKDQGFKITTCTRILGSVNANYCKVIQRGDGYGYHTKRIGE